MCFNHYKDLLHYNEQFQERFLICTLFREKKIEVASKWRKHTRTHTHKNDSLSMRVGRN